MPAWSRLIRFIADDGKEYQGEPVIPTSSPSTFFDIGKNFDGLKAKVITGDIYTDAVVTDEEKTVKRLLSPVSKKQINLVRCVGLNYLKHIQEGHMAGKIPQWPTLFIKGRSALANPGDAIEVPKQAQDTMDLEGELVVIIGKTGKNIPKEKALEHVLGVTCGNDLTWRRAQQQFPYSGSQWCYGKGLDEFAPIGPVLVSTKLIDTSNLAIESRLNGEEGYQKDRTDNMMFGVPEIIAHFSSGTTLEAGDVIMTGTPQGVGYARNPPNFLKDGDVIEVSIEGIGTLKHSIKFMD